MLRPSVRRARRKEAPQIVFTPCMERLLKRGNHVLHAGKALPQLVAAHSIDTYDHTG